MIYRGEGKNTVAIALSQADPWVEILFVSLSSDSTCILYLINTNARQIATPTYHVYMGLYILFCGLKVISFPRRQVLSITTSHNNAPCRERS